MSEQNNVNDWIEIEDHFRTALSRDLQKDALDYIAYIKAKGILPNTSPPHIGNSPDGKFYSYSFLSHTRVKDGLFIVLVIESGGRGWTICMGSSDNVLPNSEYFNRAKFPADEKVKQFAWDHVRICQHFRTNGKECGCGNQPGRRITLFGKEFYNNCNGNIEINNPHDETLMLAIQLTDVWR